MAVEKITIDFVNYNEENIAKAEQALRLFCEIGCFEVGEIDLKEKVIEFQVAVKYIDFVPTPIGSEKTQNKIIIKNK
jgi:hypothetical protein